MTIPLDQTYSTAGETHSRAIVLLHGAAVTRAWWDPQVSDLSADYHTIAADLPGHGALASEQLDLDAAVEHIAAVIDEAAGGKALVVGVSLGGYAGILHGARFPDQQVGLVLSGASANLAGLKGWGMALTGLMLRLRGVDWLAEQNAASFRRRLGDAVTDAVLGAGYHPEVALRALSVTSRRDYHRLLADYPNPVLLLNGVGDSINHDAEEALLARLQQGRSHPLTDASHLANLEQPAAFNAAIHAFAESLDWV